MSLQLYTLQIFILEFCKLRKSRKVKYWAVMPVIVELRQTHEKKREDHEEHKKLQYLSPNPASSVLASLPLPAMSFWCNVLERCCNFPMYGLRNACQVLSIYNWQGPFGGVWGDQWHLPDGPSTWQSRQGCWPESTIQKKGPRIEPPKHHMKAMKEQLNAAATFKLTEVSTMNPMPEIDKSSILSSQLALCLASP